MKTTKFRFFTCVFIFVMVLVTSVPAIQTVYGSSLLADGDYRVYLPLIVNDRSGALIWNTFLGSAGSDVNQSLAADNYGNVYITGFSNATWGTPVRAYQGGDDIFVAKLNTNGALLWNTFLGAAADDYVYGIAVDESGNSYVTGYSRSTWGTPVNAHGLTGKDAFVAKLNSAGELQWNTFTGANGNCGAWGVAVDASGNVFIIGESDVTWGTPLNPFLGGLDAFVVKLNSSGVRQWNTFLGSVNSEEGRGIAVDGGGNIYVTGFSATTWGTPINPFSGYQDVFVAALNDDGIFQWNTFMGSVSDDIGWGIAVDDNRNIYVSGWSSASWGIPVNGYAGGSDVFSAKLDSSGVRLWNTFLGSASNEYSYGIAADGSGNVYVVGSGSVTWGTPVNTFAGGSDAFAAKLNGSGARLWNTFLGSGYYDYGGSVSIDGSGHVYVSGSSDGTWGAPVTPFVGGMDAFIAKLEP